MNYEALVHTVIDPIVDAPDSILIRVNEEANEKDVSIVICAEKEDTSRLIGKKGIVANAIRELVSIGGKKDNKRIHLKFESFEGEED